MTVFTPQGDRIADAGKADFPASPPASGEASGLSFTRYVKTKTGSVDAVLHSPVSLDRRLVGYMEAVVDIGGILELTRSYRGLGATGETLLVAEMEPGILTVLNQTRHGGVPTGELAIAAATPAMLAALSGDTAVLEGVEDYRGETVWAASRRLNNVDTGLIVKIDEQEQFTPLIALRGRMVDVALSVGALAILAGTLLGFFLSRPIRNLDSVVHRIKDGDIQLRADVSGEDEVSFLAESFNELMDRVYIKRSREDTAGQSDG